MQAQTPYSGELSYTKTYYYFDTLSLDTSISRYDISKKTVYMAEAHIYTDTSSFIKPWLSQNLGTLKLNGIPLSFSEILSSYQDTIERKNNKSQLWELNCFDASKNFTANISIIMPTVEALHIIPDFIHTSSSTTFNYGNVNNADSVQVIVYDFNRPELAPYSKTASAGATSITIDQSELSAFVNGNANVILSFIQDTSITANEKNYKYSKRFNIVRPVAIKE